MSFDKLYNNFENELYNFFAQNDIRNVETLHELKKNTYRTNILNSQEKSYIINYDLKCFFSQLFGFSEKAIKAIKKELSLINELMNTVDDIMDFSDHNTVLIKKYVNTFNQEELKLTFIRSKMVLSITPSSVVIHDNNDYIKPDATMIVDDTDLAIINAIHSFNNAFAYLVCVDTPKFNKAFFDDIHRCSSTDIIKNRTNNEHFQFVEKKDIEQHLYSARLKDRFSSLWVGNDDCVMITSKYPQLFLDSVKNILKGKAYTNFVQAFNFYHNYKLMMNEQFMSTIKIDFEHKLAPLDTAVITVSMGGTFEITISSPVPREKNARNSVFQISEPDTATDETLALESDDLHELYDFVFHKCSHKISELLSKDAMDLEWRDIEVLRMIKI